MMILIPKPDSKELVTAEAVAAYFKTPAILSDGTRCGLDDALDHASNSLAMAAGARSLSLLGQGPDRASASYLPLLSPDKHSYQGLCDVRDAYERWKASRIQFEKMHHGDNSALPPTKASMQRILNDVYTCFDDNPDNQQACHFRELLQQSAQIFELPPLGKNSTRHTEHFHWKR